MRRLFELIDGNREWLSGQALSLARARYLNGGSGSEEQAQAILAGFTESLLSVLNSGGDIPDVDGAVFSAQDPISLFAAHQVDATAPSPEAFVALVKCYRQKSVELLRGAGLEPEYEERCHEFVERACDRAELDFCKQWGVAARAATAGRLQAEAERDEQHMMLRTLLNSTPDIVIFKDAQHAFRACSDVIAEMLGHTAEDLVGKTDLDLWPRAQAESFWEEEARMMASGERVVSEHLLSTPEGERWYEAIKLPLYDADGRPAGLLSTERDINARKAAETALTAESRRLAVTLCSIGDGVITTDAQGNVTLVNPVAEALTGWTDAEAHGRPLADVFHIINQKTRARCENPVEKVLTTGGIVGLANHTALVSRNGTERSIADSGAPIHGPDEEILGVVLVFRDVTERDAIEEAVRRERDFAQSLVETAQAVVLVLDTDGRIVRFNSYMEQISGYKLEDVKGQDWFATFLPQAEYEHIKEEFLSNINGIASAGGVQPLITKSGAQRTVEWYSRKLRDSEGRELGILSVGVDVTERLRAEETAREERNLLRTLIDAMPDHIYVKDQDGRTIVANVSQARSLGLDNPDDVVGKTDGEFDCYSADVLGKIRENDLSVMQAGQPMTLDESYRDFGDEERWVSTSKAPLRNTRGDVVGIVGISRDVTAHRRAEQSLAAEKERLDVTLRSIGDGVITTDMKGRITLLNPVAEWLTGWTQAEAAGRPMADVFHIVNEQTGEPCENPVGKVLATGQTVTLANHTTLIARSGARRIIADSGAPICDDSGKILGVVLVFRDVTEQKLAEEAVRRERDFAESLVETAQAIVLVLDTDGRIVRFNSYMEEISGYKLTEVKGRDWFATFLPLSEYEHVREEFLSNVDGTATAGGVQPLITRSGAQRSVEWFSRKLRDSEGRELGTLSVGIDITERLRVEADRDQQRRMLAALLRTTPDLVLFKDATSAFLAVSDTYCRLHGRKRSDIIGKDDFAFFPAEDARRFRDEEVRVMQGGAPVTAEHRLATVWGERFYDVVKVPLRDEHGQVVGLLSSERDITERKRAEENLAAEKERLDVTLRSIGDGVITTDVSGKITLLNPVAEHLTGWSSAEAVGRPLADVLNIVNEQTGEACENPVDRVLATGQIVTLANHTTLIARDGGRRIIADSGAPINDASGKILGVVLVFRDVTEQKLAEEAVRRERDFAESLVETAQAIVLLLDTDGHIVRFNSYMEEMSGYKLEEVKGQDWFATFLPQAEYEHIKEEFLSNINGIASAGGVQPLVTKSGVRRNVEWFSRKLRDSEGKELGILSVGIDITERLRAQAELAHERDLLDALMDNVPDQIYFKDTASRFTRINRAQAEILGVCSPEDAVGKTDFDYFDHAQDAYDAEQRIVETGEPLVAKPEWIKRADGTHFWVASTKVAIKDKDGRVTGTVGVTRDITPLKRAEESLAAEKERLDVTLRSIGDGVITTDVSGKITLLNPVAEHLTGWSLAEAVGRPLADVLNIVNEQTGEACENPVDRVLATGQIVTLANHTTLIARDGGRRIIADSGAPINDASGEILGVVLVFRDVTEQKLAEEAVRRERDFAESLVETAQAIVLVLDADGHIVRFNSYMEEMSGYKLEDVKGQDWFATFLPQADYKHIKEEFLSNINGIASAGGVQPLITKSGAQRNVEWYSRKLRDSEGRELGILSVGIDITERLRAQAELDEQRLMLRALLDTTGDIVIFKDAQQCFRACSRVIANLLGKPQEALVGKTDFDLFPSQQAEGFWEEERKVIEGGVDVVSEHLLDGADGPRWFEAVKKPLRNAAGEVVGLLSTERDITERKQAEEALRRAHDDLELRVQERTADLAVSNVKLQVEVAERKQAEAELQLQYDQADRARSETTAILDATSEAMALIAPDSRLLSVNRRFAEFFGLGPREVTGHRFDDLRTDFERLFSDPTSIIPFISGSILDAQQKFTQVVAQRWPRQRELEVFSTPVRTLKGDHLGRLFAFRDVTREREVDRMKTEFVSLVSHELRTPLTSIKGYVDLMLGDKVGQLGDDQRKFLGIVKNNADRLVALINDLLDVSRIESGKIELKRTLLDVGRLIQDTTNSLRPQLEAKAQRLTLSIANNLPTISGDADRIALILTNLLSNAHKYTPLDGHINVSACLDDEYVRIDVKDSGIGLTAEEQAKLFTKFFRADNEMTAQAGGTGLGLVITRSLIEMHGGQIWVQSAPDEGSTFSFTLPATRRAIARAPILGPGQLVSALHGTTGSRILVVDDEPDIAELIRLYLDRAGYQVMVAHNATDALRIAKAEVPDLITLDLMLPEADGFTVLEWLKSEAVTRGIPVVMISIMPDDGHGKMLGAVDYLVKPVPEEVLIQRIRNILTGDESKLILVADDDEDTRGLLAAQLIRGGYEVMEAGDGQEALDSIKQTRPGLVLLDIKMPIMDGISVLRVLRATKEMRDLPVIMMTASPGLLESSRALTQVLGVSALLSKPFTAQELAEAIADGMRHPFAE